MLKLQTPNGDTRVLLHSCCAPCSSAIIECMLTNHIRPTVFYCNPNIYPPEEYEIRKQEAIRFVTSQGLDFVDAEYDHTLWQSRMKGLEEEPERGRRCLRCFLLRMDETARYAAAHGFTLFTTTLASSRWKSLEQINETPPRHPVLGTELAERRPARAAQPVAPRIRLLQPTVLRMRVQHAAAGETADCGQALSHLRWTTRSTPGSGFYPKACHP